MYVLLISHLLYSIWLHVLSPADLLGFEQYLAQSTNIYLLDTSANGSLLKWVSL